MILLGMGPCPIHIIFSFFLVKGFFTALEAKSDVMGIFPLLMPLSTLSPVRTNLVKPDEELPINRLKTGELINI